MKAIVRNGILGLCLCFCLGASWLWAQEGALPKQERQSGQKAAAPPKQEQAPEKPASQPKQEQAAEKQAQAAQKAPAMVEPEAPSNEGALGLELFYWGTMTRPTLSGGLGSASTGSLLFPGKPKHPSGAVLSLPAGGHNNLRLSYFQTVGRGDMPASAFYTFFSTSYLPRDQLLTRYMLRSAKISLDYLTYPGPPGGAKFRLKTLWQVQGVWFKTGIDAPFKEVQTDYYGNPTSNTAIGTSYFIYPSVGIGIEHFVSRHFRWEAKGSGFGFPHHATIWDVEAKAAVRYGHFEFLAGYKGFGFKTSPARPEYAHATMSGPYVGVQLYHRPQ